MENISIKNEMMSRPIGLIIDDLKRSLDASYAAGDVITATMRSNEIITLRRVVDDLAGIQNEKNREG